MLASILATARPWTYWLAPYLLTTAVASVLWLAIGYYPKVLVPGYRMKLCERAAHQASAAHRAGIVRLPPAREAHGASARAA